MRIKVLITVFIFISIFPILNVYPIENRIIIKVNNEIITSYDLNEEVNYLRSINSQLRNLEKNELVKIAKKSLVKEKIITIEVKKYFKEINTNSEVLEKLLIENYSKQIKGDLKDLELYLKKFNLEISAIKEKILINHLWKQLIINKYIDKVVINKEEILQELKKNNSQKEFSLSEIFFKVSNNNEIEKKYFEIKETIDSKGFEAAAALYSASESSNYGGKIGWIKENSLNPVIKKELIKIKNQEFTNPILIPGGFLVLKLNEVREAKKYENIEEEVENVIKLKTSNQLNSYSNLFFSKIEKEVNINEL